MIVIKRGDDMEYVEIDGHKLHLLRAGDEKNPKLVFMSGSGTISPVYDFKILYEKLVSDFRIIVIEKFQYVDQLLTPLHSRSTKVTQGHR